MLHEPAAAPGSKDLATSYKARFGVWMFLLYGIVYAGFIAINFINPALMEARVLAGLNLAVVYGLGLILFALILALIYNHLCSKREVDMAAAAAAADKPSSSDKQV